MGGIGKESKNYPIMLIIDAHLDLAMNALEWNRDLTRSIIEINEREAGLKDKPDRGNSMVCLQELRKGNIGIVVATQIARVVEKGSSLPGWNSSEQAWAHTQGQLAYYRSLENKGELIQLKNWKDIENHLTYWNETKDLKKKIGYILSLEGADSIINLEYLDYAFDYGLRAIGPAHYGPGRYANGTDSEGGLTNHGKALIKKIEKKKMILDATHLCDEAFWDAMEIYHGAVWASHQNSRTIVNHNRQFSDNQFKELIKRNGFIGMPLDAWMMVPDWKRGESTPIGKNVSLNTMIDHLVHICSIAGNVNHVGIGTDLDGAFGREQAPFDMNTIADLQKLPILFEKRGFSKIEIEKILSGNILRFLKNNLN